MVNPAPEEEDSRVDDVVRKGAAGAFAVAGSATAVVVLLYFLFYIAVYLPRGVVQ